MAKLAALVKTARSLRLGAMASGLTVRVEWMELRDAPADRKPFRSQSVERQRCSGAWC
jgi:hypothetical protein